MGDLGRALEHWLDEICPIWSPQHLLLYTNVIKSLSKMWQKISELDYPRSANALIKVLAEATQLAIQNKALPTETLENTKIFGLIERMINLYMKLKLLLNQKII
jgi:chemosensory pili system protein ChpA (sensor histidine kinase/response regulator)